MGTSDDEAKLLEAQDAKPWPNEQPQHTVYVSEFEIGKYPVTNAEYAVFLHEAKGYTHEAYWSEEGKRWLRGEEGEPDLSWLDEKYHEAWKGWLARRPKDKRRQPFYWDDPQWSAPNLPVVGVTWFEAEAYCKWLSEVTGQSRVGGDAARPSATGDTGQVFRLPTEAQWEKAARYSPLLSGEGSGVRESSAQLWPWGDTWDKDKCNSSESGFNATTPVGMYPDGASPRGVLDMVGNVWEWCADHHDETLYRQRVEAGQEVHDPLHSSGSAARVLRGGSWNSQRRGCRAAVRGRNHPMNFNLDLGFRVVRSPVSR